MRFCDWFNINAIVAPLCVLFTFAFGLFTGPVMSPQVEFLWVAGIIVIAFLVWFNAAKTHQREREAGEREAEARGRERGVMILLDEIKQLLSKPGTTLEDVKMLVGDQAHFEGVVVDRESSEDTDAQ